MPRMSTSTGHRGAAGFSTSVEDRPIASFAGDAFRHRTPDGETREREQPGRQAARRAGGAELQELRTDGVDYRMPSPSVSLRNTSSRLSAPALVRSAMLPWYRQPPVIDDDHVIGHLGHLAQQVGLDTNTAFPSAATRRTVCRNHRMPCGSSPLQARRGRAPSGPRGAPPPSRAAVACRANTRRPCDPRRSGGRRSPAPRRHAARVCQTPPRAPAGGTSSRRSTCSSRSSPPTATSPCRPTSTASPTLSSRASATCSPYVRVVR